jgi:glycosyltransferase involved in cell wall biosynthesis
MKKQKVLHVTKARFPPEIRVMKEVSTLTESGYQCAVLCMPFEDQAEYEVWNQVEVFRPNLLRERLVIDKIFEQASFFSLAWFKALKDVINVFNPNIIHVHDIWLGRVVFAVRRSQFVALDLHENMPAAVVEYLNGYKGFQWIFRKIFHSYKRIFNYENQLLKSADLIFVVVEEARERVICEHGLIEKSKVINVENLESKKFLLNNKAEKPLFEKDHFSVLYIGGFGPHRGIDTLIRSMSIIKKKGLRIKVHLIGAILGQYLDMLNDLIESLNLEDYVVIHKWVNSSKVLANIKNADLCCVPHNSNSHTDTTIPHKLYQYMISSRPVLVSSSTPLARTVQSSKSGLVFKAGDYRDCADKITEIYNNKDLANRLANNGYKYVTEKGHNWEDESAPRLISAYDKIFNQTS